MKFSTFVSTLSLVSLPALVAAAPSKRDGIHTDIEILNFALTLEHLENAFYSRGLEKFSEKHFRDAGFPEWVRGRYEQIAAHEKTHVEFLSNAIKAAGAQAVEPCDYSFPDTDVRSFVDISYALESLGTSAYNGAAASIADKAYLTVAASILGVEARQSAWINSAVRMANPWNTAFETPLDMNQAFSIASSVINSCPASNPHLPVKPFPKLTVPVAKEGHRTKVIFDCPKEHEHKPLYAAWLTGTGTIFTPLKEKWETEVPNGLTGLVFVIITTDGGKVSDDTTVAGVEMVQFPFDSHGRVY
ncbi:Protein rds1 [Hypsizygus marmoreus]|uniref:Protein rds1 n=1 Tax=Hypsizygus marmoreus TaxID=39966 RepID=A0A369JCK0_HYPMA|nr:Protein rds1 [Hypsizygus marmoreus]